MNRYQQPKEWILSNQVAIMEYYLGTEVSSRLIRNPFRDDHTPTCGFYFGKKGSLYLHDFATDEHMDCITIVQKKYNLSYTKALQLIQIEGNKFEGERQSVAKQENNLEYLVGNYHNYFERYNIKLETLNKFNVISARALYIDQNLYWRATNTNPIFIYKFENGNFKVYRPLSKDKTKKWKSKCGITDISGYLQLPKQGKILFITSSLKDVMVLHEMGFPAIAFSSEGIPTKGENGKFVADTINLLKTRFENVILFLDNDEPGIKYSQKISRKFGLKYITTPSNYPKDISDTVEKISFPKAKRLTKKLISKIIVKDSFEDFVTASSITNNIFDEADR